MYTIEVVPIRINMWIAQLFHNGQHREWFLCMTNCREYAEAEANKRWPFASLTI